MALIETVPADLEENIGIFSFGPMDAGDSTFTFLGITNIAGFNFASDTNLTSVSCPNLVTIDADDVQGGFFSAQNCSALVSVNLPLLSYVSGQVTLTPTNPHLSQALTSISLPSLVRCGGAFGFGSTSMTSFSAPALTTVNGEMFIASNCNLSFPALTTVGQIVAGNAFLGAVFDAPVLQTESGGIFFSGCPNLVTVNVPSLIPTNNTNLQFTGAKLDATSVNLILARCVASAGYVAGTVDLSSGTSSAPTGQGITDKATLIGRGVSVTTN